MSDPVTIAAYDGLLRRLAELAPRREQDIAEWRADHEAAVARVALPESVTTLAGELADRSALWFYPEGHTPTAGCPLLLHLHGGGYVIGSPASSAPLSSQLALATHTPLVSLDYRLAPEHPGPAAVEDVLAALDDLDRRGHPAGSIVVVGDSAGGGLTVAAIVATLAQGRPAPTGAVCLSPWTDLALPPGSLDAADRRDPTVARWLLARMADAYLAGGDPRQPWSSPVHADLSGFPPLLIHAGGAERLEDDARRLHAAAEAAGVDSTLMVWPEMFHVWHAFAPRLGPAAEAMEQLARWCAGLWSQPNGPA